MRSEIGYVKYNIATPEVRSHHEENCDKRTPQ